MMGGFIESLESPSLVLSDSPTVGYEMFTGNLV